MNRIQLVVGGFEALAKGLAASGRFSAVHQVHVTSQLRDLIVSGRIDPNNGEVVFLFADNLMVDTPQDLGYLVQRLSADMNQKVIVLAVTPGGRELVGNHPGAALLEGPFNVNLTIGAISGMPGISVRIDPVAGWGFEFVEYGRDGSGPGPQEQARPQPSQPSAQGANPFAPEPAMSGAGSGGWTRAEEPVNVAAPQAPAPSPFARVEAAPPPQAPAPSPFARVEAAPPPQAPGTGVGAPLQRIANGTMRPLTSSQGPGVVTNDYPVGGLNPAGPALRPIAQRPSASPAAFSPQHRRLGKMIAVVSPKGGTGKSSVSLNLATYMGLRTAAMGRRVCIIDANFQQADTAKMLNQWSPNIINLMKDPASMVPERVEQYLVHRRELGISALLGPATPKDASPVYLNGAFYTQILDVLRTRYDYIFVDTPVAEAYHDVFKNFALPEADYLCVVVAPALHTLMNTDNWLRFITMPRHAGGEGVELEKIGIVLNQAQDGVDCDEETIRRELFAWRFLGSIVQTKEWLRALNNNEIVATKNYSVLNESFSRILYEITGEEVLLEGLYAVGAQEKGSLVSKLRGLTKKRSS